MDFAGRDKCKPVLPRLSLVGNLEKPLMSLYGTEWRDRRGGGLWIQIHKTIFFKWSLTVKAWWAPCVAFLFTLWTRKPRPSTLILTFSRNSTSCFVFSTKYLHIYSTEQCLASSDRTIDPHPLSTPRVCPPPPPAPKAGGEGSIFRETPDIGLAFYIQYNPSTVFRNGNPADIYCFKANKAAHPLPALLTNAAILEDHLHAWI